LEGIEVVELRVEDLGREPGSYSPGRDPFAYGPPPSSRRPKRPKVEAPEPEEPVEIEPPPPAGPPKPRPPDLDLVYLGSFGPNSRLIAVFSDGDDIHNALTGDVLEEKFIVDKIGFESADIKFVGFPDEPAERLAVGG